MLIMKEILSKVINEGTGSKADVEGWSVAGKTGTARKYMKGGYSKNIFQILLVFFQQKILELLVVVMLDEPTMDFTGAVMVQLPF